MVWLCMSVLSSLRPSVTVFCNFLLHALTYWAEILYVTFFSYSFDQVWVSSIFVNVCWSLCPFCNFKSWKYTVFRTFLLHALIYWAEFVHMLCYNVLHNKFECRQFTSMFVGLMPLSDLRILEIHGFPHFTPTCVDILSWNFAYDFFILYFRSRSSVVNLLQFL